MNNKQVLSSLKIGDTGIVCEISKQSNIRRRLMDMGILPGTKIALEGKAPMGDPIEIRIRGYKLTLRKSEADCIFVNLN